MPPPLRVLFAVGSMEVGGAERQVVRYLKRLDRSRFAPGLYVTARRGPLLADVSADVPIFAFGDRVAAASLYWPGRVHGRQVADLAVALDEFAADLLVTRTFHQTLVAGSAVTRRPTPLVAIEASDPRRDFDRQARRFRRTKKRLVGEAYRRATAVVALSEGARDGLCSFYGLPVASVSVLPNFVDVEEIDRLAAEPGPILDPSRFHVVCVGRLSAEKGQDVLLDAARVLVKSGRLPALHVHLVGDGPCRGELKRLAAQSPLDGHVTFAGHQQNPFAYLRRCQLFCLPSLYEGMPGSLLEAMACGVPVVAADCESGPREVLDGGRYGELVPVADAVAFAAAIERVARDPDAARDIAIAARQRVEHEYAATVGIGRLERLFERAAGRCVID